MKIIADENLALVDYFFADYIRLTGSSFPSETATTELGHSEIEYHAGRGITSSDVMDAQALLVRSVTKVNATLLENSPIEFVGSATIGTDHLDIEALQAKNISVAHAPGCNAQAVAEYVVTAILTLKPELIRAGKNFCLGIVGLGNVGKRLTKLANRLNWRVIGTDPYVQLESIENVSFDSLLAQSDVISLHIPITKIGEYATYHLFDETAFSRMKPHAMLINSARGAVISEQALLVDLGKTKRPVVLDVFEFEPKINKLLLDQLAIVTPHIAGYSLEGKARGTEMIYQAWCQHFDIVPAKQLDGQLPEMPLLFNGRLILQDQLLALLPVTYDIIKDDQALRACVNSEGWVEAAQFDRLRKEYPLRREWLAYGDR